jgi:hypothetical protein
MAVEATGFSPWEKNRAKRLPCCRRPPSRPNQRSKQNLPRRVLLCDCQRISAHAWIAPSLSRAQSHYGLCEAEREKSLSPHAICESARLARGRHR